MFDVLGLKSEEGNAKLNGALDNVMKIMFDLRTQAKSEKNFKLSDDIRDKLIAAGFQIKDSKEGSTWKI